MNSPETKIYLALLITAIILGCFLIFFIFTILRQQRRNQTLQKEKTFAEITTMEKERMRIAADLHDDLGPMLSSVKLLINSLDTLSQEDERSIEKANDYIDAIMVQLRSISSDLLPPALLRKGLIIAVEDFVNDSNDKRNMQIDFRFEASASVGSGQDIHLYRIIHEVIHNAYKHAQASKMDITLTVAKAKLILKLKDNGSGFDPQNSVTTHKGLGLKNIISRVETLNGEVYLRSAPEKGTEYLIEIPLQRNENNNEAESPARG